MHLRVVRNLTVALLCLAVLSPARTQSAEAFPQIKLAGIAHVALRVHDLAASRAFYQSLGFEEAFDLRRDNVPYESFIKINDRQFIELYPVTAKDPEPAFLHLCFESDDIQSIHDDYALHGLNPTDIRKAGAGNLLFTMKGPIQPIDPGATDVPQNIEYTEYQPGSLHSNDIGKHLGADRVADRMLGVMLAFRDPAGAVEFYTNQLTFKPLPGKPMALHLAGGSGEQVGITGPAMGTHGILMLDTMNPGRARRHITHEHIPIGKLPGDGMMLTDPDGNQILIVAR
jgi:catechol 2,3-dioxygenase-like lactoylglutathione lyase family enzyme